MQKVRLEGALITRRNKHLVEAVLVQDPTNVGPTDGIVIGSMSSRVAQDDKRFHEWFALMQEHLRETIALGAKLGAFGPGMEAGDLVMSDAITVNNQGGVAKSVVEKARAECEQKLNEELDGVDMLKRAFRASFKD